MSTSVFASVLAVLLISLIGETHSLDLHRESVPPFKYSVKSTTKGDNNSTTGRIVNGSNATMHEYPWMVALFNNKRGFQCGGSIISDQFILTAGHCVRGLKAEDITASLGDHIIFNQSETESDIYHIEEIKMYEEYLATIFILPSLPNFGHQNHQNDFDDVALLKVNRNIQFSENVSPICLSKSEEKHIGEIATVTGWGRIGKYNNISKILKEAQVRVIDNSKCEEEKINSPSVLSLVFNSASLCAEDEDGNAFRGDSGGPIVIKNTSNRWEQIGIVRSGGCFPGKPASYTRVGKFLKWIESKTGQSFQNDC